MLDIAYTVRLGVKIPHGLVWNIGQRQTTMKFEVLNVFRRIFSSSGIENIARERIVFANSSARYCMVALYNMYHHWLTLITID